MEAAPSQRRDQARRALRAAERRLLARLNAKCVDRDVTLPSGEVMHHIEFTSGVHTKGPVLVMLPGYGVGAAGYAMTIEALACSADSPFSRVFALDWPGTGLSGHFDPATTRSLDGLLDYAIASIEGWRAAMGLERLALLGHSMGAYLAFAYSERHAGSVVQLILASPVGLAACPSHRHPAHTEASWLEAKAADLEAKRRNRTDFDRGSPRFHSGRGSLCLLLVAALLLAVLSAPLVIPLACCLWACRRAPKAGQAADVPNAPLASIVTAVPWASVRWLISRVVYMARLRDQGQWGHGKRHGFAAYVHAFVDASACVSFGEHLYSQLMTPYTYGTFWCVRPIGGDCCEIPFADGKPASPATIRESAGPFTSGRLQSFVRSKGRDQPTFRLSFIFGEHDWVDCRPAVDVAREFAGTVVNAASGGDLERLPSCGHQIMMDAPAALAAALVRQAR